MFNQKIALPKSGINPHQRIVGNNSFTYQVDAYWGQLNPDQLPVENCHAMAFDSLGRIFMVTDNPQNNIIVYDKNGNFLDAWGTQYPGAHGIKIVQEDGKDVIYIVDSGWILNRNWDGVSTDDWDSPTNKVIAQSGFVAKLTIDGHLLFTIGHPQTCGAYEGDMPFRPTDIAIDDDGNLYVADGYGSDYILCYSRNGQFIKKWGGHDNQDENANICNAHGIEIDRRNPGQPTLMVSSRAQQCLKRFSLTGEHLKTISTPGAWIHSPVFAGDYGYAAVCWSHIDGKNADQSGFICIFDQNDKVVATIGAKAPQYVDGELQTLTTDWSLFHHCHGLCVDQDGDIYIGQWRAEQSYPMKLVRIKAQ